MKTSLPLYGEFSDVGKLNDVAKGLKALALSGDSTEAEREEAIERLESDNPTYQLNYIFTVDIFNEGVDIPKVNQIIMLRPTQSAITKTTFWCPSPSTATTATTRTASESCWPAKAT